MRISDWSSDVCSSDLRRFGGPQGGFIEETKDPPDAFVALPLPRSVLRPAIDDPQDVLPERAVQIALDGAPGSAARPRSEEPTSELQSLMRTSYAVLCLKKKTNDAFSLKTQNQT